VFVVEDEELVVEVHVEYVWCIDGFELVGVVWFVYEVLCVFGGGVGVDLLLFDMYLLDGYGFGLL